MPYPHQVVIVIPVYKPFPDPEEIRAVRRAVSVFSRHPIRLLGPDDIDYSVYLDAGIDRCSIIQMPGHHFRGIKAYNRLLCSKGFYAIFDDFEYILIFQTDAWVFRDELSEWCERGYDYIGSPWLWRPERVKNSQILDLWPLMKGRVGNGGVSLRKIKVMKKYALLARIFFALTAKNEDFIWLLVSLLPGVRIKKPNADEALKFCIEMEPEEALNRTGSLPFTVHAYMRYGADYWKAYMPD